jgi:hypothetical protein
MRCAKPSVKEGQGMNQGVTTLVGPLASQSVTGAAIALVIDAERSVRAVDERTERRVRAVFEQRTIVAVATLDREVMMSDSS